MYILYSITVFPIQIYLYHFLFFSVKLNRYSIERQMNKLLHHK